MAPRPPTVGLDFFGFARHDTGALRKTFGVAEMTSCAAHWGGFSGNKPWSDNFDPTSHIALTTLDWPSQNVEGGNAVPYSGLRASTPVTPMGIMCKSPGTVTMPFRAAKASTICLAAAVDRADSKLLGGATPSPAHTHFDRTEVFE